MNTNSPLVPQGTTPPRGKSTIYFKVLMILGVHVVLIGGMLLQGCKDTAKDQSKDTTPNAADPGYAASTNPAVPETAAPVNVASLSNQMVAAQPATQPAVMPAPVVATQAQSQPMAQPATTVAAAPAAMAPSGESREYVIASGDTLGAIAKRNHVSLKSMLDANPGVDAKKLKIGQKVQVPGSGSTAAVAATSGAAVPAAETASTEGSVYVVKTGDTLTKIARVHGTTYKKLMAMNDLKTTAIRVGQKIKLPAPKPAGAESPASASTAQPQPAAGPMPVSATVTPQATAPIAN
jgi:peptidoglycan DL-endopeptidase LytF